MFSEHSAKLLHDLDQAAGMLPPAWTGNGAVRESLRERFCHLDHPIASAAQRGIETKDCLMNGAHGIRAFKNWRGSATRSRSPLLHMLKLKWGDAHGSGMDRLR